MPVKIESMLFPFNLTEAVAAWTERTSPLAFYYERRESVIRTSRSGYYSHQRAIDQSAIHLGQ
jgi:hypothetical protein